MTFTLLVAAFAMGFFGSPHCLGMCGGLVTAFGLSMHEVSPLKKQGLIATYHLGRLFSYALLGVIAGLIGTSLLEPLMIGNNTPRVLLGLVLAFIGLTMLGAPFLNKLEKLGMRFWQKLAPLRQKVFPLTTYPRALSAGLLWGFLPCGLVYAGLMMAVVGHDIATGATLMFAFGLGTVPMLVATHETVGWLHKQIGRFHLRQLNGVVMILSGIAIIMLPIIMQEMGGHGQHGASHASVTDSHHEHESHNNVNHDDTGHSDKEHSGTAHTDMNHSNMQHADMEHNSMSHADNDSTSVSKMGSSEMSGIEMGSSETTSSGNSSTDSHNH